MNAAPFHARFILAPTAATKCRGLQVTSLSCYSLPKAAGTSTSAAYRANKPLRRHTDAGDA